VLNGQQLSLVLDAEIAPAKTEENVDASEAKVELASEKEEYE
jgi:hypothetical protein